MPYSVATSRASSVGTTTRSARRSNQKACVVTMSVTTVMNGVGFDFMMRSIAVFTSGCTDTMMSAGFSRYSRRIDRATYGNSSRITARERRLPSVVRYEMAQVSGNFVIGG
ncbi:MAG: hypothetical protein QM721_03310 [Micropruina sp.]